MTHEQNTDGMGWHTCTPTSIPVERRAFHVPGQPIVTTSFVQWLYWTIWYVILVRVYAAEIALLEQRAATRVLRQAERSQSPAE